MHYAVVEFLDLTILTMLCYDDDEEEEEGRRITTITILMTLMTISTSGIRQSCKSPNEELTFFKCFSSCKCMKFLLFLNFNNLVILL